MPEQKEPIWRLVEQCARELTNSGITPFTRSDLIGCVKRKNSRCPENSINPVIQGVTDNLRGGAPGAAGKGILHSVGRGQFVFKATALQKGVSSSRSSGMLRASLGPRKRSKSSGQSPPNTEAELRDTVMLSLYQACGIQESLKGSGSNMAFRLGAQIECRAEQTLHYVLPNGVELGHASDILISDAKRHRYISIELKYKSAVTDQFKCRAYDIQHLKSQYGDALLGVMLFVKSSSGISISRAKAICYPFDRFFGFPVSEIGSAKALEPLQEAIEKFMKLDRMRE